MTGSNNSPFSIHGLAKSCLYHDMAVVMSTRDGDPNARRQELFAHAPIGYP